MKRIAMISFHTCPLAHPGVFSAGGLNVMVLSLARELARAGFQVDLFTKRHTGTEKEVVYPEQGLRVIHLPVGNKIEIPKEKLLTYAEEFAAKILEFFEKDGKKPEVIYAHYYLSGVTARIIKSKANIPFALTYHTLGILKRVYGQEESPERVRAERELSNEADLIFCATNLEKNSLVKHYEISPGKILVSPPGVDHRIFHHRDKDKARKRLGLLDERKVILFVGRLDPIKGITRLLNAVNGLARKYPDFKSKFLVLLIGGKTRSAKFWRLPEVVKIKETIARNDLECCVKFLGFRPHATLAWYYAAADVVAMPSLYESFGLVALEALASGAAVLVSKVGGLRFLVKNGVNGVSVSPKVNGDLEDKLWEILNDESFRDKLGVAAAKTAKKYSWKKHADEIVSGLKKIAE